jgi:hypothetical protein
MIPATPLPDTLIQLTELPRYLDDPVCVSSLYHYAQKGLQGVKLETVEGQYGKYTSLAALRRFRDAVAATKHGAALLRLLHDPPANLLVRRGGHDWVAVTYAGLAALLNLPRRQSAYYVVKRLIASGSIERRSKGGRLLLRTL